MMSELVKVRTMSKPKIIICNAKYNRLAIILFDRIVINIADSRVNTTIEIMFWLISPKIVFMVAIEYVEDLLKNSEKSTKVFTV